MTVDIPEPPTQQVLANAPDQHVQIGLAINDIETLVTAEYIGAPGPVGPMGPPGYSVTTYVQATAPDPALVDLRVGDFWVRKPPNGLDPQPMFTWDGSAWLAIYGKPGADGTDGVDGADGVGVPSGGTTGQMLTKASGIDYETTWTDLAPVSTKTINAQTGTAYTLVFADANEFVTMNNTGASTLTVPPNSAVPFPVGTVVEGAQLGTGQVTITPGAGVTVNAAPGRKVLDRYGTFGIFQLSPNVWIAFGRLAA